MHESCQETEGSLSEARLLVIAGLWFEEIAVDHANLISHRSEAFLETQSDRNRSMSPSSAADTDV